MSSLLAYLRRPALTQRELVIKRLSLIIPPAFLLGAGMEFFMIKTGFYDIALRKEAERRYEKEDPAYQQYRQQKKLQQQQQQQQQPKQ